MFASPYFKQACLIGPDWRSADSGQVITVTNPATDEVVGTVPRCGRAETAVAIDAAQTAFSDWRARSAAERSGLMLKLAALLVEHQEELGRLLTTEQGKPLAEATGEIVGGAAYIRWFAEEARRVYGDVIPSPWPDRRILVLKEPLGVVGAITPWNFPNSMMGRKLGAALAAGCTMVLKPASQTPFSALAVAALVLEAGIPAGVFSVVTGGAAEIAAEMCENPLVRKITFTGSTEVGKKLAAQGALHMKRVSMELGGNAPFIVFDDADLDAAVQGAMISKFRNSGQTCVCTNRFLVQSGVHDAFVEGLGAAMDGLKLGSGLEPGTTQGPLIDMNGVKKIEEHIADALARGAKLVKGGARSALGHSFFEPTLLIGVTPAMKLADEETFAPLAPVFRFETEQEALRLANATEYGLAGYVYTRDLSRTFRMMEGLQYGIVGVNAGLITTEVAPFGGYKDSGVGREGSKYGVEDYLNVKYACIGGLGQP